MNLSIAIVCSSNMNRSMEAQAFLQRKGFRVRSFGTGDRVRLPGPSAELPNCYDFGVSYAAIYNDLVIKDKYFYTNIGLLNMLDRNRRIKLCPEKFQDCKEQFNIIVTCEERVYDQVLVWFHSKASVHNQSVHIVNVDIQDNHEDATIGAFIICDLMTLMSRCTDLDNKIDEIVQQFELQRNISILNCIMYY